MVTSLILNLTHVSSNFYSYISDSRIHNAAKSLLSIKPVQNKSFCRVDFSMPIFKPMHYNLIKRMLLAVSKPAFLEFGVYLIFLLTIFTTTILLRD